jgi:hypothetical protein
VTTPWPGHLETVEIQGQLYVIGHQGAADFLHVNLRQAEVWHERRARNGYPEGITAHFGQRKRRLFDMQKLVEWRKTYRPGNGGAGLHGPNCGCKAHKTWGTQLTLW